MAHKGQQLLAPDGLRLRLVRTAAETDGELLEMEADYPGNGSLPPEHFHPHQSEAFEVLEGTMRAIIGGEERRYAAGQTFEVPTGTPHQMTAEGPSRVRWEVRPALRTAEFFERLYGADPSDRSDVEAVSAFLREFSEEIRFTGS